MELNPTQHADPPTVLVLDDDELVREAAVRHLRKSGYEAIEAANVESALGILRTTPVVAALLDMRLPERRTGLDVLIDLRRVPEFHHIPVLIVTGAALSDEEVAAIAKERAYVFFKPEGMKTIVNFLDHLTGREMDH